MYTNDEDIPFNVLDKTLDRLIRDEDEEVKQFMVALAMFPGCDDNDLIEVVLEEINTRREKFTKPVMTELEFLKAKQLAIEKGFIEKTNEL